jgi:hypothetical protein
MGKQMTGVYEKKAKGAIEIIEEAIHLLRLSPGSLLASYYTGSLPFTLGLLYFWADMSRNAYAVEYCAPVSLGLAMLFLWMKCWQAVFASRVKAQLSLVAPVPWSFGRIFRLAATQAIIQSSALFLLPIALVMTIPFAWLYAFYQSVSAEDHAGVQGVKLRCKSAWQQAKLWPAQNHILLSILFVFGLFLLLNLGLAVFMVPHLVKTLLGFESIFTLSGSSALNTTFLAATFAMAYLCMDPLVKTIYALRCFYGSSLRSGDDLKTELSRFLPKGKALTLVFILFLVPICPSQIQAGENFPVSPPLKASISPKELDRSIQEVLERREFTWRMPRERHHAEETERAGFFSKWMAWLVDAVKAVIKALWQWIINALDWLKDIFQKSNRTEKSPDTGWMDSARDFLVVLIIILACLLALSLYKMWKKRKGPAHTIMSKAITPEPDPADDDVKADALPVERWLALAQELREKGSLRLALRALYLAILAQLAEQEIITLAKHKSNGDYEGELHRRAHGHKDLQALFSKTVAFFDRAWYGMHPVTREHLDNFTLNQERITAFAGE